MQPLDTSPKYRYELDLDSDIAPAHVVRMVGKNKRVLEIGCASGSQTKPLSQQFGCDVTGIEINPEAAEEARPYCKRLLVGDIERMDLNAELGDSRFDVITFGDVLEHLRDPKSILDKVRRFIDADGYVLISVPNIAHASVVFELMNGRFDYRSTGLLDDTHIHFFYQTESGQNGGGCELPSGGTESHRDQARIYRIQNHSYNAKTSRRFKLCIAEQRRKSHLSVYS